ncbi:MAG: serine hydrolase [Thermoanaerobaculia bacterium]|jgi:CubicO group peptidase (beta-lactamase class C family)
MSLRTTIRILPALSLLVQLGCRYDPPPPFLGDDQSRAIDRLVATQMAASHIPGMAVAVVRDGVVVKRLTVGEADIASRTPVTSSTPFQLASTTKSFSATAVLLLVADGRLTLDARVGDLVDGLPAEWQPVTVRQLLSHTSGLPDIVLVPGRLDLIANSWERAFLMVEWAPMQFAPGEKWAYTQTNYALLAKIVERVSDKPLERFMAERLFVPFGMKESFFAVAGDTSRAHAVNYEIGRDGRTVARSLDFPPYVHAAGGLCASLDDLIRWNAALDRGDVLDAAHAKEMWTAVPLRDGKPFRIDGKTTGYGLGWVVDDAPGHRSVGHSGGNSTAYRRYLDEGFTVIVLHNGVADPDALVASIAAIVRGEGSAASAQERLWEAAKSGDGAAIESALGEGADIEALDTRKSRSGRRALNWAAWFNHRDAIRLLLRHGAKIDAENATGFTALHHAAEAGSLEAADALLAAGADPNHRNGAGFLPAETARAQGHPEVAARIEARRAP